MSDPQYSLEKLHHLFGPSTLFKSRLVSWTMLSIFRKRWNQKSGGTFSEESLRSDARFDLHCHSTCSDGTCTPLELLELAKERELSGIAITDHDTLDAYTEELFAQAQELEVKLYVGVEFSTRHQGYPVHLLGYGLQKTPEILAFCQEHQERRLQRNRAILEKLSRLSMVIDEKELGDPSDRTIGRPHIAERLMAKGYVQSIREAFDRFLGEGKPCFEAGCSFGVEETITKIHAAGGKAFIAHPYLVKKSGILKELLEMPFDGIECYYSLFHNGQEKKWLKIAEEKGWLISGGSDFHGSVKPHVQLGCSWVPEEDVLKIFGER
ncbi:5'-3' exoribonuclease [Candidatus Neptunochlamydia vexilliferae]|uniref:5'-3' exoribonuclease n=2 Tax=Candidatus Neptunichlamydia vexilliferae TaxID=1651774 RepID=A0ABS0AX07_9BACT|nr:5'-3' exoribonuclease [Candidatus Neptunochlamydia vexilliferae]